jgi:Flp pilus assembly protein TadD
VEALWKARGCEVVRTKASGPLQLNLNTAIELNPKFAPAYNGRGFAYGNKGDLDRAIADLNTAIELDPNSSPCA